MTDEVKTDYDELDSSDEALLPVVDSEYDLKTNLIRSEFRDKEGFKTHDLISKELVLSNIPDTELASIYVGMMECIESFLSMGFDRIAKSLFARMLFRYQILRSVGANEFFGQYGQISTSSTMERSEIERSQPIEERETPGRNPLPKLFSRIRGKRV